MTKVRTPKSILVIDDEADLRETLSIILNEEGYEVMSAGNGAEALDRLRSGAPPSLILLDLMMPVMNGWQFRAEQRQDPQLARIPVVIISADAGVETKAAPLEVADCLKKPLELATLLRTIERHCQKETPESEM